MLVSDPTKQPHLTSCGVCDWCLAVIEDGLKTKFTNAKAEVVWSPDFREAPFHLASQGEPIALARIPLFLLLPNPRSASSGIDSFPARHQLLAAYYPGSYFGFVAAVCPCRDDGQGLGALV